MTAPTTKNGASLNRSVEITRPCFHQGQIKRATGSVTTIDLLSRPAAYNTSEHAYHRRRDCSTKRIHVSTAAR